MTCCATFSTSVFPQFCLYIFILFLLFISFCCSLIFPPLTVVRRFCLSHFDYWSFAFSIVPEMFVFAHGKKALCENLFLKTDGTFINGKICQYRSDSFGGFCLLCTPNPTNYLVLKLTVFFSLLVLSSEMLVHRLSKYF